MHRDKSCTYLCPSTEHAVISRSPILSTSDIPTTRGLVFCVVDTMRLEVDVSPRNDADWVSDWVIRLIFARSSISAWGRPLTPCRDALGARYCAIGVHRCAVQGAFRGGSAIEPPIVSLQKSMMCSPSVDVLFRGSSRYFIPHTSVKFRFEFTRAHRSHPRAEPYLDELNVVRLVVCWSSADFARLLTFRPANSATPPPSSK